LCRASWASPSVDVATVSDSQDEISVGDPRIDHPVVADAKAEEARELTGQTLAGSILLGERFLDLLEDPKGYCPSSRSRSPATESSQWDIPLDANPTMAYGRSS
jgi:hypothetical protein